MLQDLLWVLLVFALLVGLLLAAIFAVGKAECSSFSRNMGLKTTFDLWGGCFVEMQNGEMLPKNVANQVLSNDYRIKVK
jgi:hypothetical protein